MSARIYTLHRGGYASARQPEGVNPLPPPAYLQIDGQQLPIRTFDDIAREHGIEAQCRDPYRPSTLERIADALGSERAFPCYVSFIAGCFFTVGLAALWARFL